MFLCLAYTIRLVSCAHSCLLCNLRGQFCPNPGRNAKCPCQLALCIHALNALECAMHVCSTPRGTARIIGNDPGNAAVNVSNKPQ